MIVVDTNILAHFWLPSDSTELCDKLYQKDPQWVAPMLWRSEFRNVVTLYLRKELIDLSEALLIMEKAELQMKERQFQVNSVQVLHYVSQSQCSSYDCEFVSLAKDLDLELITLDKQLLQEFPQIAKHPEKILES
ncbi:type II toxin-antitoxin system VapC family toxin [Gracilimonas tropica]|uniref:type II toxin-antitoxin system VapC family toxin n=1 Tax=Gracilimonas tropica TaxID=454600 RepID=UPI000375FEBA|nr:type II toxin-antitoxin system VapC family toxin [Gracilimonas tropica]